MGQKAKMEGSPHTFLRHGIQVTRTSTRSHVPRGDAVTFLLCLQLQTLQAFNREPGADAFPDHLRNSHVLLLFKPGSYGSVDKSANIADF